MMAGAVAANAAEPAAAKIGVVDMQAVATQSEPAQAAKKQMESKYGKERAALEKQGEALKKAAEELKGPKASDEKKLAFIRKKQELDQKTRNFLRKVEQDEVKLRQDMVTLVFNATYNVAQRKGFNFVVPALSCAGHRAKLRHYTHQRSFSMSDATPITMDIQRILSILPHRYPFLLVDRVLECVPGSHIRAYKNVTINEPFFQGHFPGAPIMPGVLILEALAQAGALLAVSGMEGDLSSGTALRQYPHEAQALQDGRPRVRGRQAGRRGPDHRRHRRPPQGLA